MSNEDIALSVTIMLFCDVRPAEDLTGDEAGAAVVATTNASCTAASGYPFSCRAVEIVGELSVRDLDITVAVVPVAVTAETTVTPMAWRYGLWYKIYSTAESSSAGLFSSFTSSVSLRPAEAVTLTIATALVGSPRMSARLDLRAFLKFVVWFALESTTPLTN